MDEWAVRGAEMKTGLGRGKSERCVVAVGVQHERGKVGYVERKTDE